MGRARGGWLRSPPLLAAPLLLTLALVPLAGPARAGSSRAAAAVQPEPDGKLLYLRDCGVCHGEAGEGTPRGQSLTRISPAEVDYAITTGRMPVSKPGAERRRRDVVYTDDEIEAIVDFMRPFIAKEPDIPEVDIDEGDIGHGGELYSALCAACHQWAAKGGALLGDIESPPLDESTPRQVAEAVLTGPVNMPSFVLSDEEIASIAAYVEYLKDPEDRGGGGLWHFGPFPEGAVAWVVGLGAVILVCRWIGTKE